MKNIFKDSLIKHHSILYVSNIHNVLEINSISQPKLDDIISVTTFSYPISECIGTLIPEEIVHIYGHYNTTMARAMVESGYNKIKCDVIAAVSSNILNSPEDKIAYYCVKYIVDDKEMHEYGDFIIPEMYSEEYIEYFIDSQINSILCNIDIKK